MRKQTQQRSKGLCEP